MREGWICPRCRASLSPDTPLCSCAPETFAPLPMVPVWPRPVRADCGCPPNGVCLNSACPRRMIITCGVANEPVAYT